MSFGTENFEKVEYTARPIAPPKLHRIVFVLIVMAVEKLIGKSLIK
jgi:hypothetical protein